MEATRLIESFFSSMNTSTIEIENNAKQSMNFSIQGITSFLSKKSR